MKYKKILLSELKFSIVPVLKRLMNKINYIYVFSFFFLFSCVTTTPLKKEVQPAQFAGTWQFPNRGVWILISESDYAFQCRIDKDSITVYRSKGILKNGNEIHWEEIWGVDTLRLSNDTLTLSGKYGKFRYIPAHWEVSDKCGLLY